MLHRLIPVGVFGCALVTTGQAQQPGPPELITMAEATGYKSTSTYESVIKLMKAADARSPLIFYTTYGKTSEGREMPLVIATLSPCGSTKTLDFMRWLGISVPHWLENELRHAGDILEASVRISLETFEELLDFAREKGFPLGCNVESVSLRRAPQ